MATLMTGGSTACTEEVVRFMSFICQRCECDATPGRRADTRYHRTWPLRVTLDPTSPDREWGVALHNASERGIGFLTSRPLAVNQTVFVKLFWDEDDAPHIPALVRHVTATPHGYLVGCSFRQSSI